MMRANTKMSIKQADIIINVPLDEFGSLDWRRSAELIDEGYKAAESMRDSLLPLAVSEAEYATWKAGAPARRRRRVCRSRRSSGSRASAPSDERQLSSARSRATSACRSTSTRFADRSRGALRPGPLRDHHLAIRQRTPPARTGCSCEAQPKPYGPPFLMLGLNLENTTSEDFRVTLTGRYLAYDVIGPGSELRIDGTLGSDPGLAFELYKPLGIDAAVRRSVRRHRACARFDVIQDDAVVASYGQTVEPARAWTWA